MAAAIEQDTKNIIKGILISSPLKITASKLNLDFMETVGYDIPFKKMGYNSLMHFLHSISDVIKVNGSDPHSIVDLVVSEKSAHVNDMVLHQKKPKLKNAQYKRKPTYNYPALPTFTKPSRFQNCPKLAEGPPRFRQNQSTKNQKFSSDTMITPSTFKETTATYKKNSSLNVTQTQLSPEKIVCLSQQGNYSTVRSPRLSNPISWSKAEVIPTLNETLTKQTHRQFEGMTLSFKRGDLTQRNVIEVQRDEQAKIPPIIQNNLRQLITEYPEGIWCTDLPLLYKKRFKKVLDYSEFGYRCLASMCMELCDVFQCVKASTDDYKLFDINYPVSEIMLDCETEKELESKPKYVSGLTTTQALPPLDWNDFQDLIPKDVLKLGDVVPRCSTLFEVIEPQDTLDVVVAEIYDPSKFWLFIDDGNLDALMNNLQSFYYDHCKTYLIPEYLLEENLYCVALILKEYHRGVIVDTLKGIGGFVKVYFIDYGTVANVSTNCVWFLHNDFAALPQQAIRGRLSGIYPATENKTWSRQTAMIFRNLISMKKIVATVVSIDKKKEVLDLLLADTSQEEIKFVNTILVEQGHARFTSQARNKGIIDENCIPKVKYIHLFPTHAEIERGVVPSSTEMNQCISHDISLDFCYPQYFKKPSYNSIIKQIEEGTNLRLKKLMVEEKDIKKILPDDAHKCILRTSAKCYNIIFGDLFPSSVINEKLTALHKHIGGKRIDVKERLNSSTNSNEEYERFLNKLRERYIKKSQTDKLDSENSFKNTEYLSSDNVLTEANQFDETTNLNNSWIHSKNTSSRFSDIFNNSQGLSTDLKSLNSYSIGAFKATSNLLVDDECSSLSDIGYFSSHNCTAIEIKSLKDPLEVQDLINLSPDEEIKVNPFKYKNADCINTNSDCLLDVSDNLPPPKDVLKPEVLNCNLLLIEDQQKITDQQNLEVNGNLNKEPLVSLNPVAKEFISKQTNLGAPENYTSSYVKAYVDTNTSDLSQNESNANFSAKSLNNKEAQTDMDIGVSSLPAPANTTRSVPPGFQPLPNIKPDQSTSANVPYAPVYQPWSLGYMPDQMSRLPPRMGTGAYSPYFYQQLLIPFQSNQPIIVFNNGPTALPSVDFFSLYNQQYNKQPPPQN